ncbi:MAG: 2-dehydropantoate 2-reductase [Phycisphaerales bacterium]|nr:2-dehydropantoate 2-reductase [Phycisphaerales bacterium]
MTSTQHQPEQSQSPWTFRRAAVIGAGAMGTLLTTVLGATVPVVVVCRNPDRAAHLFKFGAKAHGQIEGSAKPILIRSIEELPNAGGADAVFVATKTTAIPSVAGALAPVLPKLCKDGTPPFVVSFQNGIEPGQELMRLLHHEAVLRIVLSLGAVLEGDHVQVSMNSPPHVIGGPSPVFRSACEAIAGALTAGGLDTAYTDEIEQHVWRKAIVNAAMNPVAALANCTVGDVLDAPARTIVARLLDEGVAVANAEGLGLPATFPEAVFRLYELARQHVPSMVEDIRRGRESEVGQLNRQIIEHGLRLGVQTPTHETIDALIETFDWKVYHHHHSRVEPAAPMKRSTRLN